MVSRVSVQSRAGNWAQMVSRVSFWVGLVAMYCTTSIIGGLFDIIIESCIPTAATVMA